VVPWKGRRLNNEKAIRSNYLLALMVGFAIGAAVAPPALAQRTEPNPARNAYFGELHTHSSYSLDAYVFGTRKLGPEDVTKYAQGLPVTHPGGFEVKLAASSHSPCHEAPGLLGIAEGAVSHRLTRPPQEPPPDVPHDLPRRPLRAGRHRDRDRLGFLQQASTSPSCTRVTCPGCRTTGCDCARST